MTYAREIELIGTLDEIFKTTRRIARTQLQIFDSTGSDKTAAAGLST
jgi:hypothetical protein